jgi:hypothetical protein
MKRLRHRKVKQLIQGDRTVQPWMQDSKLQQSGYRASPLNDNLSVKC